MLDVPIESLPRTSPLTIKRLKSLEIKTYFDLINYFPFRYEDYSLISSIGKLQPGEKVTIIGKIKDVKNEYTKRRFNLQKIKVEDGTGELLLTWFNQYYLIKIFKEAAFISISGEVQIKQNKINFIPKEFEVLENLNQKGIHTGRIIPIYPEKRGLSSKTIREKIFHILQSELNRSLEIFPKELVTTNHLIGENEAYTNIHFPKNKDVQQKARERLSFDELFVIQMAAYEVKKKWQKETVGNKFDLKKHDTKLSEFIKKLPFELTDAQQRVVKELLNDLATSKPMNRFLQGDVGSGKTVVAALACYLTYLNGFQSLFMAPTEILANQHFKTLSALLNPYKIKVGVRTSGTKTKELSSYDVIVGTHALLNEKLNFKKIGFVVVDEQHRFGVRQRAQLKAKGINPHLLTMTATPIPRTVALTLYGELDISVLDELPKGRVEIKTYVIPKKKREAMYEWLRKKIKEEQTQVFIICPLIEESEKETVKSVKAAKKEYEYLTKDVFSDLRLALLHGKLKSKEKDEIMSDFKNKKYDILVSTSVVEVGIDIPNATIMVIEGAEKYGLAQLHQLRGRVGRGKEQSYCLIFTESESPNVIKRLNFFSQHSKGVDIAGYDLKNRGPGEIFGTRQHGIFDLKIASFTDYETIEKAKKTVLSFDKKYDLAHLKLLKARLDLLDLDRIAQD